jgi:hypothetical protein
MYIRLLQTIRLFYAVHWNLVKKIMHDYICYDNTAVRNEITKNIRYIYCSAVNLSNVIFGF